MSYTEDEELAEQALNPDGSKAAVIALAVVVGVIGALLLALAMVSDAPCDESGEVLTYTASLPVVQCVTGDKNFGG